MSVKDGDSIVVHAVIKKTPKNIIVRLYGIDAPELSQDYGKQAKVYMVRLALHKHAVVQPIARDVYGRLVSVVRVDDRVLNEEMLSAGDAWWYQHYAPDEGHYRDLEHDARGHHRGLWADKNPEPPWQYRREHE